MIISTDKFTGVGQLPETSIIQKSPNQKSIIDHILGNILDSEFVNVEVPSMNFKD